MFSLRTQLTIQNSLRCVACNIFRGLRQDPGINRRRKLLNQGNKDEVADCDFDDLETDFMEVHQSHKEHMREMETAKEKLKYHIVKQKYFKEKFPNFLTWHDKEQIRYLFRTNSQEWPIERLSEGFPALPGTIKKIVKGNWTITDENRIKKHDEQVQNNWNQLKHHKFQELPKDLKDHLRKFTNRSLIFKTFVPPVAEKKIIPVKGNIGTEFADIIKNYQKTKEVTPVAIESNEFKNILESDDMIKSKKGRKAVTLKQLQTKVQSRISNDQSQDADDHLLVKVEVEDKSIQNKTKTDLVDLSQEKYQSKTGISYYRKMEKTLKHLSYPQQIIIPKKCYKRGYTYKLNDCYYADDGEFLYRVPGMI